jgi:hypothetical protein
MPIRAARNLLLHVARIAALLIGLAPAVWAQSGDSVEITLEEARILAVQALQTGNPGLAIQLASGLLQADPKDPLAHYLIASGHAQMGQPRASRRAAAKAYRFSPPGPDRFRSAQLAARMAYAEKRYTLAQVWLRRTAIHISSDADEALLARDYRLLRLQNPWAFRLRTDLRPSSNVNNGADTALQIIDGVPVTGTLSGSARALSGMIGSVDLALSYRLQASEINATSVAARLYVQRVALSSAAQDLAPNATGSDFASTFAEVSLRHGFRAGPPGKGGAATVDFALGESWWGGERSYRFARLIGERAWQLRPDTRLNVYALGERRYKAQFRSNDAKILGVGAEVTRGLKNGDSATLEVAMRDTDATSVNGTFTSASVRVSYTFRKPVGPAHLTAGLVFGYSDYPTYVSGGLILVPGGRQDQSVYGDLSLFFDQYDYAGFAPMLRVRAGRKTSNDSRFDTRELSVSLGIESKF